MIVCTFYGGPGTGKSTTCAGVFYQMKTHKVNCEYAQEYAKDKTWEANWFSLGIQPYIAVKQLYRFERLRGKVDLCLTDGPLLNSLIYPCKYVDDNFHQWLVKTHSTFNNVSIFIDRNVDHHGYEASGRSQDLEQAMEIDRKTLELLDSLGEPYHRLKMGPSLVEEVVDILKEKL